MPQNVAQQIVIAASAISPLLERTRMDSRAVLIADTPSVTMSHGLPEAKKSPGVTSPHTIQANVTPMNAPGSASRDAIQGRVLRSL
jgi:hypothetical protein